MTDGHSSRVPEISDRQRVPEDHRHLYDHIKETRGAVSGPFRVLFHSPEAAGKIGRLGTYVRYESALDGDVRELAIITTAREFTCAFEWATHEPIARAEGVSDDAIEVLLRRNEPDELSETEALVVRYGRELLREHRVSDATFRSVKEHFGVRGVTELTVTIGYYSMLANVLNAFEIRPNDESDVPEWSEA